MTTWPPTSGPSSPGLFLNCLILKTEAICLSTMSVTFHPLRTFNIPEEQHLVPDPQISQHVTWV